MVDASILPLIEPQAELPDRVAALLRALDIAEIVYELDGGGDSGETSLESVRYRDGRDEATLPMVAIGFLNDGRPLRLHDYLGDLAADLPEGDWVNNEGGHGNVTIRPFEADPSDRFACDMTYREDYDEDEDPEEADEELFEDVEFGLADDSDAARLCMDVLS